MKTSFWHDKHVLITGGAGFIGRHMVRAFAQAGAHVYVYDTLATGNYPALEQIIHQYPSVHFYARDIARADTWATSPAPHIDHIVHLAAVASVPAATQDPATCFETNITGTFLVLQAAGRWGSSCTFASSAAVYGAQDQPCREDMAPQPHSWYGHSKYIGEQLCAHAVQNGVPVLCFRYFNVVGTGQRSEGPAAGVSTVWMHRIKAQLPLVIQGDGLQVRDFISVADIVQAHLALPQLPTELQDGRPINLCSGTGVSLVQWARQLAAQEGFADYPITFAPARPGDITHSVGDCSRYKKLVDLVI